MAMLNERAVRIAAAAMRLRDEVRIPLDPTRRDFLDRRLASARAALDDKRRAVAWADGYAFTVQQAIAHALEEKKPVVADFSQPATEASELQWLTRRERQVAALVAEGLRNQQIADGYLDAINIQKTGCHRQAALWVQVDHQYTFAEFL